MFRPVFSKLDAELAKSMMGVNAVKAVELGSGVGVVEMKGSENRDLIKKDGFEKKNTRHKNNFFLYKTINY